MQKNTSSGTICCMNTRTRSDVALKLQQYVMGVCDNLHFKLQDLDNIDKYINEKLKVEGIVLDDSMFLRKIIKLYPYCSTVDCSRHCRQI